MIAQRFMVRSLPGSAAGADAGSASSTALPTTSVTVAWGFDSSTVHVQISSRTTCGDICHQLATMKKLTPHQHVKLLQSRAPSRSRSPLPARSLVPLDTDLQAVVVEAARLHTAVLGVSSTHYLFQGGRKRCSDPFLMALWRAQTQLFVGEREMLALPEDDDHKVLRSWEQRLADSLNPKRTYIGYMNPEENGFLGRTFVLPSSRDRLRDIRADFWEAFGVQQSASQSARLERQRFYRIPDDHDDEYDDFNWLPPREGSAAQILTSFGDTFKLNFGKLGSGCRSGSVCAWLARSEELKRHPILGIIGCLGPLTPTTSEADLTDSEE